VTALLPSLTDTNMVRELQRFRWVVPMTPEQVAKALVAGLYKRHLQKLPKLSPD